MSYAEAEWSAGSFDKKVEENVEKRATSVLEMTGKNVAGVFLPTFRLKMPKDNFKVISRMKGAMAIMKTRQK
jgi:vacuolar-type H+-ATPase subunit D/Vma8